MAKTIKITDWIFEIFNLHIQWIKYTFKGLIILGLFPSTAAVFAVIRYWLLKRETESLAKLFRQYYYDNYKVANVLGWFFLFISFIVLLNFFYIPYYPENFKTVMYAIIVFMSIILLITWTFLFPAIVHYKLPHHQLFLVILKSGFSSIGGIMTPIISTGIFIVIILKLPALLLFFGITPLALVQETVSIKIFKDFN